MRNFLRSPIGISLLLSLALLPSWPLGLAEAVSHIYWNAAFKFVTRSAPSSIVVVSTDGMDDLDTADEAKILDSVRRQMPRRVFVDLRIPYGLDAAGDAELRRVSDSYGDDIAYVARSTEANRHDDDTIKVPADAIVGKHKVYVSAWNDNFIHAVVSAPYQVDVRGRKYSTFSVALSGAYPKSSGVYYPDFSVNPDTITRLSARALLDGKVDSGILSGRTVIVSSSNGVTPLRYWGHSIITPVAHDIAGAEALSRDFNVDLTFAPLLVFVVLATRFAGQRRLRRSKKLAYYTAIVVTLGLPILARFVGFIMPPEVAIIYLCTFGAIRVWQKRTRRIQQTSLSGLPNFVALSAKPIDVGNDVIVAVVARYEEMLATLPRELHGECANQIARRLSVGSGAGQIYHGDGGHFAWSEEARPLEVQLNHLEGLRALFSAPLQVGVHTFDTNIHFGLDRNEGIDALTRVNSALASANEALGSGRPVEVFEAHRLAEAPWELSLHARIDEGLRNGDIWLAFQPQWDFRAKRISGAEALIRWNHPTRGFIAPDQFILQAERAGRIDALTYWVLEEAITAAQAVNALGARFQMSINLSAQMVHKDELVGNFEEIVTRRGINPSLLTIEITETSSLTNRADAVRNLTRLRDLGFRLSIDDFGTGEASLAYLADLPSDELKIDRRFISKLLSSDRDRAIVTSTIGLAHALGQVVVAEGIEDLATFEMLAALGCDQAQGYYLSKPQPFDIMFRDYVGRFGLSKAV
ncbi:EAL domain-containing protein [Novosphingobium sp. SG720]|uniref:EAL domain-containing protein n=1 Tax=Novosphingobium sp. SG720 TaxID=2586998 RepID=UPI0017CB737E|nr:EAL domain-containing protein [Novosphingobium sp. SG720]NKJ41426.1 EAL domain-containing protein (putative c-di-GMP-specific phosphodiesterase class I) [Novosphingobium sp. SG720]